jgi:hypothetical protein
VTFFWKNGEAIAGYSYAFDQDPIRVPDEISEGPQTSVKFERTGDGIWYFHVRAYSGDEWGGVTHSMVRVDGTPPAAFDIEAVPQGPYVPGTRPMLTFLTTDATSGMSHYEVRTIDLGKAEGGASSFFPEESSPYAFSMEAVGAYQVVVRAFDKAGNSRDAAVKIERKEQEASPPVSPTGGFMLFGYSIPWWWLWLLVACVLAALLGAIWLFRRRHARRENDIRSNVVSREERLLAEYKEMYENIRAYRNQDASGTVSSGVPSAETPVAFSENVVASQSVPAQKVPYAQIAPDAASLPIPTPKADMLGAPTTPPNP